jgi:putative RecB family exonuclease
MGDFLKCPKAFWYKSILRLPSAPTVATTRGTLTHTALEELFAHPRDERTPEVALAKIVPAWEAMKAKPEYAGVVAVDRPTAPGEAVNAAVSAVGGTDDDMPEIDPVKEAELLQSVEAMVTNYFAMERPQAFDPTGLELRLTAEIEGVTVHGIVDRLDTHEGPAGTRVFVSDYKTGREPRPRYLDDAFFAMKIYAVLVEEALGTPVHSLRLLYLVAGSAKGIYTLEVNETLNDMTRSRIKGIAGAIRRSHQRDEWATKKGPLCNWCDFQPICPAFNPGADGMGIDVDGHVVGAAVAMPRRRR